MGRNPNSSSHKATYSAEVGCCLLWVLFSHCRNQKLWGDSLGGAALAWERGNAVSV